MTNYKNIYYPESKFGGFTDIDGTIAFYSRVNSLINSSSILLDIGCGRGAYGEDPVEIRRNLRIMKGKCRKVIGIDVDKNAKENPFLDEFYLLETSKFPVEDESIDICICDNVLEHIEDPELFFSECNRVIKKDGYLCIRTPNANSYIALISKLIPNKFHAKVLNKINKSINEQDVFLTYYRCNTTGKIKSMLKKHDFEFSVYGYEAEPSYLSFNHFAYLFGVIHQKLAPEMFRASIFAFGRKNNL